MAETLLADPLYVVCLIPQKGGVFWRGALADQGFWRSERSGAAIGDNGYRFVELAAGPATVE
jgi:hypothetical protein